MVHVEYQKSAIPALEFKRYTALVTSIYEFTGFFLDCLSRTIIAQTVSSELLGF